MNTKELRIGNFIFNHCEREAQVESIGVGWIKFSDGQESPIDSIQPIQLTGECLMRAGFNNVGSYYQHNQSWVDIEYINYDFWFTTHGEDVKIKHVHQLQNLYFALTGIELTFND